MQDDDVIRLLHEQRPEASPLELDQIKQRVHTRAARTPGKVQSMRSRLAILLMLVLGMLMSGTGAVGAVSGIQSTNDASIAQYGEDDDDDDGDVLGEENDNGGAPGGTDDDVASGGPDDDEGDVAGESAGGTDDGDVAGETDTSAGQPAEQATASAPGDELPFTGFAAIPVLVGGVALLAGGLALRRRQD